mmetsp:Transcript_30156/g.79712  ORF Transcript_30156/g.79712 Transcript_30156/m.79712 type:complete len:85 (-) Transcript_30156:205-459(-)
MRNAGLPGVRTRQMPQRAREIEAWRCNMRWQVCFKEGSPMAGPLRTDGLALQTYLTLPRQSQFWATLRAESGCRCGACTSGSNN